MSWSADQLPFPLPLTLGHEGVGTVTALGAGAEGFAVGEAVAVYGPWGCGSCSMCAQGKENDCLRASELGIRPPGLGAPGAIRSREFDVNRVGRDGLRHLAGVIAKEYDQEAVLTFRCLPRTSPETDAVEIEVPGVGVGRLSEALAVDPAAREKLGGGSVTLDGRLVLVVEIADLDLARTFTVSLGADWNEARLNHGDREFVS